jgi:hypothetical protein
MTARSEPPPACPSTSPALHAEGSRSGVRRPGSRGQDSGPGAGSRGRRSRRSSPRPARPTPPGSSRTANPYAHNVPIWVPPLVHHRTGASAHNGGSARVIKSSSRRWSTRPLPTSEAPGTVFMHCRSWREGLLLPHIAPASARCRCVAAGTGSTKHLGRRLTGPPAPSHTGLDDGLPRCFVSHDSFVRRRGDTERQGMPVELPATLISRPE